MIHYVLIKFYVNILIHLNLLDYCTALDRQILIVSNLIKANKIEITKSEYLLNCFSGIKDKH